MAKFRITKQTTVASFMKQFSDQIGGVLHVHKRGQIAADNDKLVADLGAIVGTIECRTSLTVERFEQRLRNELSLKVTVFTKDENVHVLGGITLEKVKTIPNQATKKSMESFISYKRSKPRYPFPIKKNGHFISNKIIEDNLPCSVSIAKYEKLRSKMTKYVVQEDILEWLFDTLPNNKSFQDILLKVTVLNNFYSAGAIDVYTVAEHYSSIDIDKMLKNNDFDIVDALVKSDNIKRNFYSLASKYCSHHSPDVYPIYDSFVDKMLIYFRNRDYFAEFEFGKNDLKHYPTFVEIINKFRQFYGLEDFSLRQIDTYLWLLGKEAFKKNEKQ